MKILPGSSSGKVWADGQPGTHWRRELSSGNELGQQVYSGRGKASNGRAVLNGNGYPLSDGKRSQHH